MPEIVLSALAAAVAKRGVDALAGLLKEATSQHIKVNTGLGREALLDHLKMVEGWSNEPTSAVLVLAPDLQPAFTELAIKFGDIRERSVDVPERSLSVRDLISLGRHCVVLGRPGAGKTTSVQHIARVTLEGRDRGGEQVPIVLPLRALRKSESPIDKLLALLGIVVEIPAWETESFKAEWKRRALTEYLDAIHALVLLDGLDELHYESVPQVREELSEIVRHTQVARLVITCRTGAYEAPLPQTTAVTILPLDDAQIFQIASTWLGSDEARDFTRRIRESPVTGAEVVPLRLVQLCILYKRRGGIPSRPSAVYELLVRLLIEDWDGKRGLARASRYAAFSTAEKERFLRALAYQLSIAGYRASFSHHALVDAYRRTCSDFNLPLDQARDVAIEIESHTGLLIRSGDDVFEFSHKTYQEFLTANYLLSLSRPFDSAVPELPEELAITVALSLRPDVYVEDLVLKLTNVNAAADFLPQFLARLSIERPDYRPSARLGWNILSLLGLMFRSSDGGNPLPAVTASEAGRDWEAVTRLFTDLRIRGSVTAALEAATIEQSKLGYTVLRPTADEPHVAKEVIRYLERLNPKGAILPSALFARLMAHD